MLTLSIITDRYQWWWCDGDDDDDDDVMVTICNSFQIPFDGSKHREAQMGLEWGHQTKREATETTKGWNVSILWQKRQKIVIFYYLWHGHFFIGLGSFCPALGSGKVFPLSTLTLRKKMPRRFQVCVCAPLLQMMYDTYVKMESITDLPCFYEICHRII